MNFFRCTVLTGRALTEHRKNAAHACNWEMATADIKLFAEHLLQDGA
jgi:hypothetical protein